MSVSELKHKIVITSKLLTATARKTLSHLKCTTHITENLIFSHYTAYYIVADGGI